MQLELQGPVHGILRVRERGAHKKAPSSPLPALLLFGGSLAGWEIVEAAAMGPGQWRLRMTAFRWPAAVLKGRSM